MTEQASKARRFWHWFNTAAIPSIYVSWGLLALTLFVVSLSIYQNSYGFWFWLLIASSVWSVYDISNHYWRKRHPAVEDSCPCDDFGDPAEVDNN